MRPAAALACSACFASSQAGVLRAFYLSTGILTVLPFIIIGAIIFSIARISRRGTTHSRRLDVVISRDAARTDHT